MTQERANLLAALAAAERDERAAMMALHPLEAESARCRVAGISAHDLVYQEMETWRGKLSRAAAMVTKARYKLAELDAAEAAEGLGVN